MDRSLTEQIVSKIMQEIKRHCLVAIDLDGDGDGDGDGHGHGENGVHWNPRRRKKMKMSTRRRRYGERTRRISADVARRCEKEMCRAINEER